MFLHRQRAIYLLYSPIHIMCVILFGLVWFSSFYVANIPNAVCTCHVRENMYENADELWLNYNSKYKKRTHTHQVICTTRPWCAPNATLVFRRIIFPTVKCKWTGRQRRALIKPRPIAWWIKCICKSSNLYRVAASTSVVVHCLGGGSLPSR